MSPASPHRPPAVLMQGVVKRFPGVQANDGVDLRVLKGEIHTLLGENGAGKTTLMKILAGFYQPDAGEIRVNGRRVLLASPKEALAQGIGMIHQHFQLVSNLTVSENIVLGLPGPFRLDRVALEGRARALAEMYGFDIDVRARIWELSVGEQQRVEILRMLFRNVDVLIMDEPTAVLAPGEIERLFAIMRRLKEEGKSIIFITHKLEEVLEISDYITVLRRGKVMSTVKPDKLRPDGQVSTELARMMVGREVILEVGKQPQEARGELLRVVRLSVRGDRGEMAVKDISFEVAAGEIFAVLGVAGNGQRELVEALVGLRPGHGGRALLMGRPLAEARAALAYVPEDRLHRGSIPTMTLAENMALTRRREYATGPLLNHGRILSDTGRLIEDYRVMAPGPEALARQLSGGNLQKLILAREFARRPVLLIAEQPTRGLDIGATEEVWQALLRQRQQGGVLLVSGDLKEVLSLADRVLVLFRGRAMDIIDLNRDQNLERIGPLMAGLKIAT